MQVTAALEFATSIIAKRKRVGAYPGGADAVQIENLIDAVRLTTQDMDAEEMRLLGQRTERARAGRRL